MDQDNIAAVVLVDMDVLLGFKSVFRAWFGPRLPVSRGSGEICRVGSLCAAYSQPTNLSISQAGGTATAGSLEASILHNPQSGWDRAQLPSQGDKRLAPSLVR